MDKIDCVYLMGGIGKRANLGYPKQFVYLGGRPMFLHGLTTFLSVNEINKVIIPTSDIHKTVDVLMTFGFLYVGNNVLMHTALEKNVLLIENGNTRQHSVYSSLEHVETKFLLIGEAVRPFVKEELITRVIKTEGDAVTPVSKMKATVIMNDGYIPCRRENIGEVQMPQKFRKSLLDEAYRKTFGSPIFDFNDFTDDCELIFNVIGTKAQAIEGIEQNIKVTTPLDIKIAESIHSSMHGGKDE